MNKEQIEILKELKTAKEKFCSAIGNCHECPLKILVDDNFCDSFDEVIKDEIKKEGA